jgi:hypothetical protein
MKPEDRIKIHRHILLEYNGYIHKENTHPIYQRSSGWEPVRRAVRDLCIQEGIHIELDQYPKTRLITITLSHDKL